jgi:hypothetical protein
LRLVWLFVIPFLALSRPTPGLLLPGGVLATTGLLLRGWAAGSILKDQVLAVGGPYRFIRNPLYVGSFLLGAGAVAAGGSIPLVVLFLFFFSWSYGRALRAERTALRETFGPAYEAYRTSVPAFLPRFPLGSQPRDPGARGPGVRPGPDPVGGESPGGFQSWGGEEDLLGGHGFSWRLYLRNKEWQAALGTIAVFGFLVVRWRLGMG